MLTETRTIDAKGRITLPKAFAESTVLIEQVSDTEIRIRKARVVPEDEVQFPEEGPIRLSPRDWKRFLDALDNPPAPNAALKKALAGYKKRHG
ncbi:MAG TPA: DUF1778 domain-containing protein [Gemmataceae bacterium]|jgi:bifunctional DNA-binding transcriptional regulator/antitoxin component of YhaV-PrlF toxin-antitoxin module|nr:DUF1778 domain-containing protein [Gemmataceae bacterium]